MRPRQPLDRLTALLPPSVRAFLKSRLSPRLLGIARSDYARRVAQESERFAIETNIHDLPPIFHYWSNKFLRPMIESFGFSNPDEFYALHIAQRCSSRESVRCLSIGAGNCDTEIRIAETLLARGCTNFSMTCVDLVPAMLERGRAAAHVAGVSDYFGFEAVDINAWDGGGQRYDIIIANQCLHHFVELERLFDRIPVLAGADGTFITSDMIGRNGHQRWPEARAHVEAFWEELPHAYRFNQQLRRQETGFLDWDCSVEGFEGIRSQDILPLLCERFGFEFFVGYGNLVDPFIDRSFGWNFDAGKEWDRAFIDRVHAADEEGLEQGRLTPTHMLAIMTMNPQQRTRTWQGRTPQASIRVP